MSLLACHDRHYVSPAFRAKSIHINVPAPSTLLERVDLPVHNQRQVQVLKSQIKSDNDIYFPCPDAPVTKEL